MIYMLHPKHDMNVARFLILISIAVSKKNAKSKAEAQSQKKLELERRLEDVSGQLGGQYAKKQTKKGKGNFVSK